MPLNLCLCSYVNSHTLCLISVSYVHENRPVHQSSTDTLWEGYAEKAIDNRFDGHLINGLSCTLTQPETNPWWALEFGHALLLEGFVIMGRTDCCSKGNVVVIMVVH